VQAARAGERLYVSQEVTPFPELSCLTEFLAFPLPRAGEPSDLAHPICELNRRVSLRPRTPSSHRAVSGLSKHCTRCSPVGCSTESGVQQQPRRVPLFVNTTPTNLVSTWLKCSGGTDRYALKPS
jgi:hypothetical protein